MRIQHLWVRSGRTITPRMSRLRHIAPGRRLGRLAIAIVVAGLSAACADCFPEIPGRVVECGTAVPVAGAAISVTIDMGFHEGAYARTFTTDASGNFGVDFGGTESCGAVVTLAFTKSGFTPLMTQVTGAADPPPLEICMTPTAP